MNTKAMVYGLLSVLILSLPVMAANKNSGQSRYDKRHEHKNIHQQSTLTPKQAAAIARQRQPGKVLSVKRSNGAYKVKMLHDGRVRYIYVNDQESRQ